MQQRFFDLLLEENRKGATILLSSHVLSEVQRLCSRVAIIKEGSIIKLEKMSDLTEHNYKKIRFETSAPQNETSFDIPGVSNLDRTERTVSFLFKGNVNVIMKKLAEIELQNIWIEEPNLEEIFMHYYAKEA
jgi:ABC-2 type transport system ATP-binding protein